ncbi:glycosyltransferase [Neisseria leonii]|uniref:Glycosyltransferase n=1 Tax=Neisseria leonii TaxID=2995413 RepID=A0A9X4E6M0_9NEIS|nr:glycosyltransferase [Neisseria sp. 51.81]MDD9328247.1 glycosyltransferase [Neisseria sp. 51.81]
MKILILHKWLVAGGIERVLLFYLAVFKQLNYQVDLLLTYDLGDKNVFRSEIPAQIHIQSVLDTDNSLALERAGKRRKKSLWHKMYYELCKWQCQRQYKTILKQKLRQTDYDLVIDFSECLDKLIRQKFFRLNVPSVRWIHGKLIETENMSEKRYRKYRKIFQGHRKIITICPAMQTKVASELDLNHEMFTTIYNPIDLEAIRQKSLEYIPEIQEKYFLQVSRMVEGKGHLELLEIYAELKQNGVKHKLVLIGGGDYRPVVEQKITELNLTGDCLLLGEIKNPYPYFKQADLFLFTSESEGLGMVLLESLACGTPVISMDCPTGPKDILGDDQYGKLIPMHDQAAFVEAVMELAGNPARYQYYVEQSLKRAEDFSIESISKQIDHLFGQLTGRR